VGRETNKQRRERSAGSAREKAAAARAEQQRLAQRKRAFGLLGSVVTLAVIGALVAYLVINQTSTSKNDRVDAANSVVSTVTSVSPASLQSVGQGSTTLLAKPTQGDPALTSHGKPEVLFIGGEFCPYCAAERWSLVQALSRFGTFTNLSQIRSAADDGDIATFSFYKSSYTSKYISFDPVEAEDRAQNTLEAPTAAQQALWTKYSGNPPGFPFLDFGGKYQQTTAGYQFADLDGLDQQQIAAQLKDPSSKVAQDILGEANNLTATICALTNNRPASACSSSVISSVQSKLSG
jgi:type II secretory pathway pseudopilin PulG